MLISFYLLLKFFLKYITHTIINVTTKTMVDSALISGLTPTFIIEYTLTGSVVDEAPDIKKLIITSSNDIINASAAPEIIPGSNSGTVMCKKACQRVAPKSLADSSKLLGRLFSLADTTIITKGTQKEKCDKINVVIPNFKPSIEKICKNAIPTIISGVKTGR